MEAIFNKYQPAPSAEEVKLQLDEILSKATEFHTVDVLKKLFGLLDLTTLEGTDTYEQVKEMADKVNKFHSYSRFIGYPNVAAICVYPSMVPSLKENLNARNVQIAAVGGGFPASQTFIDIKVAECKAAVEAGADEIDMVISIGKFLSGDYKTVFNEIAAIKKGIGEAHLKVILESGTLETPENIKKASIIAMEAGADFIKTSTGKTSPAATLEAAFVMCQTIKEFFKRTGKKIGFKPAGGVATPEQAIQYYSVVNHFLGKEWVKPELFRIGASRLANNLLQEISNITSRKNTEIKYF